MQKEERKKLGKENREWGMEAEQIAAEYFLKQGYVVRERNWKAGRLEVDLILEKDRTLIFVEVKARRVDMQDPVSAVNQKKRLNIIRAADIYLRQQTHLYQYRFDIIAITGNSEDYRLDHYADAYLPPVNNGRRR